MILEKLAGLSDRHSLKIQRPWFSSDGLRSVTLGTLKAFCNVGLTPSDTPTFAGVRLTDSVNDDLVSVTASDTSVVFDASDFGSATHSLPADPAAGWAFDGSAVSGSKTYTLPSASGTLALTSDIVGINASIAQTRALASYGQSDGATTGRGVVYTNATRQALAGLPTVQIAFEMLVPTSNPASSSVRYLAFSSSATASGGSGLESGSVANGTTFYISEAGAFVIRANGATTSDSRVFTGAGLRTTYSGQRIRGLITLTAGTTNPVVKINGTDVSASFTASTAGTPPNWLDASLSSAFQIAGFNWPSGEIPLVTPIIGSLSTTERTEYFATGRLPAWVMAGGHAQLLSAENSSFEGGSTGNWSNFGSTISSYDNASDPDGIGPAYTGTKCMKVVRDSTSFRGPVIIRRIDRSVDGLFEPSFAVYDFEAWVYIPLGSPISSITAQVNNGTGFQSTGVAVGASTKGSWQKVTTSGIIRGGGGSVIGIALFSTHPAADGGLFYVDGAKLVQRGATTVPGWQGIGTVRDLSTLGGTQPNQGRLVGVRPVLATPSPVNISVFPLSTTGAFLTLASTNPLAFTPQRIVRAEVIVDTAGADLTFRNNSSSTNDIITALTDIPSANTATALTLIAAQTRLAPNATVWGSLSAGTGFLIVETCDSL